jgi:Na+/H+-dicarboxylate symporters
MPNRLTRWIIIGLVLGIVSGYLAYAYFPDSSARYAEIASLLPTIFLRLIKMIIAPLVFATLVVGIAKLGDIAMVGKVGGKALAWFIGASLISLTLGLILVQLFEPGKAMQLPLPEANAASGLQTDALSLNTFISHTVPTSVIDAMARNEILQIVVFSLFFGTAMASLGERSKSVIEVLDAVAHIMLKVTGYVMLFAPLAVVRCACQHGRQGRGWASSASMDCSSASSTWRWRSCGWCWSCSAAWSSGHGWCIWSGAFASR